MQSVNLYSHTPVKFSTTDSMRSFATPIVGLKSSRADLGNRNLAHVCQGKHQLGMFSILLEIHHSSLYSAYMKILVIQPTG